MVYDKNKIESELIDFCSINNIDIEVFRTECLVKGFYLLKYGDLNKATVTDSDKKNEEVLNLQGRIDVLNEEVKILSEKLTNSENKRISLEDTLFKLKNENSKLKGND